MNKSSSKICVICGKEFHPNIYNRQICYDDHHHPCPVCGKDVVCNDPKRQHSACSRKCGQQQGNLSRKASLLAKYGVTNVSCLPEVRSKISTKLSEVKPSKPAEYKDCEVCGKSFELHWPYTQHTCSPSCRGEYRRRTGIAKLVAEKAAHTNMMRRGVPNVMQDRSVHIKVAENRAALTSCDGTKVASTYEKLVYDYCVANSIPMSTQVPVDIIVNDKPHVTYIDFNIDGILFECKGGHLIDGCFESQSDVPTSVKLNIYNELRVVVVTDDLGLACITKLNSENANMQVRSIDVKVFENVTTPWRHILDRCVIECKQCTTT